MRISSPLPALSVLILIALGCGNKKEYKLPDWPWEDPVQADTVAQSDTAAPVDPVVPEGPAWTDVSAEYSGLPEYVKIFKAPSKLEGQNAVAFIADVDLSKAGFGVWGLNDPELLGCSDALKTPSQVYSAQGNPAVVINGGYFYSSGGKNYAASLAVSGGTLLSPNINYASEDWVSIYYPTRAVFLAHKDGTCEAAWSYFKSASEHWVYQQPAENDWSNKPLKAPSASFPSAGAKLEAENGIGGGPLLLKDGELRNTFKFELFDGSSGIGPTVRAPRTAIGVTPEKRLVLFVCEGRNQTPDVPGFTTEEVAGILKDYGCSDAINLDGGGSSLMLVCGKELIKPSDGKQRSVGSCVFVK